MKKIMFVIGCLGGGGAERVVAFVSSKLVERGFDVSILTYYKEINEYAYSAKINRINISEGFIDSWNKLSKVKKITKIRKVIKEIKPDEIICFFPHVTFQIFMSTIFSKYCKRISFAVRANPLKERKEINKNCNKILKFIKRIITQNGGQSKCFSNKLQDKISVIPNPMYDELFEFEKKYSRDVEKIVSVGRLTEQKNYELAINAFEKIHDKFENIKYYIYGVGPLEIKLKKLVECKNLDKFVFFMGFENNREIIYSDKDIFLMTSKFEGMPNALAEAMCKGIPSISTDCDFGPRDLILNKDMGILLSDYNVETVALALETIIINYNDYVKKAQKSREILKSKYSAEKVIDIWEEVLK